MTPAAALPEPLPAAPPADEVLWLLAELRVLLEHHTIPARGYLDLRAAALYLGVKPRSLRAWVRTRRLPYHKPGKEILFRRADLDAWMDRFRRQEGPWPASQGGRV